MRDVTLVLVGPHGAGKTTLGRLLAARLGCRFDDEIGRALRAEALARDPGQHALAPQPAFDEAVTLRELARDRDAPIARVVETWHPGNLAYAAARSPEVVRRWTPRVRGEVASRAAGVLVQPLRITRATAQARRSEPGPDAERLVAFFEAVGRRAERLARRWGLRVLPPLATDDRAPEALADDVLAALASTPGDAGERSRGRRHFGVQTGRAGTIVTTSRNGWSARRTSDDGTG